MPVRGMDRRAFIASLLVAAVITRPTFAESTTKTIGILSATKPDDPLVQSFLAAFMEQLRSFGWIEGRNIRFEHRWASGDPAVLRKGAQELEALAPSAILAVTAPSVLALKSQKSSTPIVFVLVIDAVALGVVNNLARPGANVTGFTNFEPTMGSKWLGLLKEMAPNVRRVGCILNPDLDAGFADVLINAIQSNAASFAVEVSRASARSISDIDPLVESFSSTAPTRPADDPQQHARAGRLNEGLPKCVL